MRSSLILSRRDFTAVLLSLTLNLLIWISLPTLFAQSHPPEPPSPPLHLALLSPPSSPPTARPPSPSPHPQSFSAPTENKPKPFPPIAQKPSQSPTKKNLSSVSSPPTPAKNSLPETNEKSSSLEELRPSTPITEDGEGMTTSTDPEATTESAEGEGASPLQEKQATAVSPSEADYERWLAQVRKKIAGLVSYPASARRLGLEGTITLKLSIGPRGELLSLTAVVPKGLDGLARAAKEAAHRSAPFPPPPAGEKVQVEVPVVFRLNAKE